jgi:outer membrane protein assembly factor BamB
MTVFMSTQFRTILCATWLAACACGQDANWNVFRGPHAGVSPWTNAPVSWDGGTGRGVLWRTPLKMAGVSSPVLWNQRLYLTEGDEKERVVMAFDAGNGRLLWRRIVADGEPGTPLPPVSDYGLAMPTPACDANGVYALFGTGDLAAFSPEGKPLWSLHLGRPKMGYGFASSPCVASNLVFAQFDHHASGRVLAVETATGRIKWDVDRSRGASWSSLFVVPDAEGKPLVVANANGSTTAYDLRGRVVWDVDGATGEVAPSPAWWHGRVYSLNVGSKLFCHKVYGGDAKLWEYTDNLSEASSPVVVNGLFFMAANNGHLTCLDANTGKKLWARESPGCYASLVSSGDRVYAMGRDGTTLIVGADRAGRMIATCALGDASDATPAMSDGRFYIRGSKGLWCIGGNAAGKP